MANSKAVRLEARNVAEKYLAERGFEILDRDWNAPPIKSDDPEWNGKGGGRLPLVARDRRAVVSVKLKLPSSTRHAMPLDVVHPAEQRRLRRLTAEWCTAHGARYEEIRIDLVILRRDASGQSTIEHIRGVH